MHKLVNASTGLRVLGTFAIALLGCSVLLMRGPIDDHRHITIGTTFMKSDLADLRRQADAIAVVEVVGNPAAAWNSVDGRAWGEPGVSSFVYSDTPVRVVRLVRGSVPQEFALRLVGGSADGVEMVFEASGEPLVAGERYLAFLARLDFPTEDGVQPAWTSVRLGQGLFRREAATWRETIQNETVQDSEVDGLAAPAAGG